MSASLELHLLQSFAEWAGGGGGAEPTPLPTTTHSCGAGRVVLL